MNFFDRQAVRRRQSWILLGCFLVAMAGMAFVIHGVIAGLSILFGNSAGLLQPSRPAVGLIIIVWLTIIAGAFFRFLDVRGGGAVLARRFGAVRAADRSRFDKEQLLLNVVAEMAIASSTAQPEVFVLREESSINAFVLGAQSMQQVIVVTQGALDAFSRDELQAVIAHEFGHISNGDLPLNMRLLMALGGLMAIDEVGRLLIGDALVSLRRALVSRRNEEPLSLHPGVALGYLLRLLGSIGVVAGQLIQSAFSRQREYLADATAVQFTRNPFALASALDTVRQHSDEPALHGPHVQELAHLCFQSGPSVPWYRRLTASHPEIDSRIEAIDRHFAVKRRKQKLRTGKAVRERLQASGGLQWAGGAVTSLAGAAAVSSPGRPLINSSGYGSGGRNVSATVLSDRILLLLSDKDTCLAALFAVFVSEDARKRQAYLSAVAFGFNQSFADRVKDIVSLIPDELHRDQLGIIAHACAVLHRSIKHENRQRIVLKLERLLAVSGDYTLMGYATLQLIRRKLGVEFPLVETLASDRTTLAQARSAKAFDSMGSEFALLLSLMVETSGAPPAELDAEFERVLRCYTKTRYPRRTANETGIIRELEAAFQTLYVQPKPIRQAFVKHCLEIVQRDGNVVRAERTLLDLFAASLGCEELAAYKTS